MADEQILKEFKVIETGSKFISQNFNSLQKKFGDQFVMIKDSTVLASAKSFDIVLKELNLKKVHQNEVIIQFIPREGEIILY